MNPRLATLQPYPFERLRALLDGVTPDAAHAPLNLSIGEPKHATPALITDALTAALPTLAHYPATAGSPALREAIAAWIGRRYGVPVPDPLTQVIPINGSREALFAFAQTVLDGRPGSRVVCPNPFYQIYEGAALLAGATPYYVEQSPDNDLRCDWAAIDDAVWRDTQLLYVCSPGNPTGTVMALDEWKLLFELSDRHGFAIAADECYSEIYLDESAPPMGALQAAHALGRHDYRRLVVFSSLSKRSNVPGMRSGFVAGDAQLLKAFLLYRTYHGSAMSPPVQAASIAAWNDEAHVRDNRRQYREKFDALEPLLAGPMRTGRPEAGFYFWARVPGGDDAAFVRDLYRQYNVLTLPGSYLARTVDGRNPGQGFVRLAVVEPLAQCVEAAQRIRTFLNAR
ncbi:MAG TPA: succinyldiaminopimelate transaminase [Quisquiliibacterium sp.]|nr:succinyldiaminopimelate transaminase [Quisquiliibacterium sp.]HQD82453.1 succinyldiaminopimelate transaminase [Quisquiliibacterium sp.]HQN11437.1 succinyldiaminopimelate transaminase [Quisquiliibacterium sp.]